MSRFSNIFVTNEDRQDGGRISLPSHAFDERGKPRRTFHRQQSGTTALVEEPLVPNPHSNRVRIGTPMTNMLHFSAARRFRDFLECGSENAESHIIRHSSGVKECSYRKQKR